MGDHTLSQADTDVDLLTNKYNESGAGEVCTFGVHAPWNDPNLPDHDGSGDTYTPIDLQTRKTTVWEDLIDHQLGKNEGSSFGQTLIQDLHHVMPDIRCDGSKSEEPHAYGQTSTWELTSWNDFMQYDG